MLEATIHPTASIRQPIQVSRDPILRLSDGSLASALLVEMRPWVRSFRRVAPIIGVLALSAVVALAMFHFREPLARIGNWGYFGVVLAEMGNSALILVPTPTVAYTFSMGGILNPVLIGALGGFAAALGELTGYYLGTRGRQVIKRGPVYDRFESMSMRWGGPALFAAAILPVPFDVAGIWAGSVRYPLWRFLVYVTPGKVAKVTAIAVAGYYGISWMAGPLG